MVFTSLDTLLVREYSLGGHSVHKEWGYSVAALKSAKILSKINELTFIIVFIYRI